MKEVGVKEVRGPGEHLRNDLFRPIREFSKDRKRLEDVGGARVDRLDNGVDCLEREQNREGRSEELEVFSEQHGGGCGSAGRCRWAVDLEGGERHAPLSLEQSVQSSSLRQDGPPQAEEKGIQREKGPVGRMKKVPLRHGEHATGDMISSRACLSHE